MMKVLVTGAAGFIGFHLSTRLLQSGKHVVGIDDLNDYYDVNLKKARLAQLEDVEEFKFYRGSLSDKTFIQDLFHHNQFDTVVNLAAQAGVRYSIENPYVYVDSNISGFLNVLEGCRHNGVKHLVFASSSSVYGMNTKMPFAVQHNVDHPVSLYAATKKAGELMAHTYSHLFNIPTTGLRFFTVYGPWGRPDMAMFLFTKAIIEGKSINVFNHGNMQRDFTYIDDIVEGIYRVIHLVPKGKTAWNSDTPDPSTSTAPYRLYNIGNNNPVSLNRFISVLEQRIGKPAKKRLLPIQPGDVPATYADISDLETDTGFHPVTSIEEGIRRFVDWYCAYYKIRLSGFDKMT